MIKKADIILIAALLLLCGGLWSFSFFSSGSGSTALITVDGKPYGEYPLDEEREIVIERGGERNLIRISGSSVQMESANCPGGDCKRQGAISKKGESIICLPHRIVIEVRSDASAYDVIVS